MTMQSFFWAKTDKKTFETHDLLLHMLDVAAVASVFIARQPETFRQWISDQFGLTKDQVHSWMPWVAGQHDFGKATAGFQTKTPQGTQNLKAMGLKIPPLEAVSTFHDASSKILLRKFWSKHPSLQSDEWRNDVIDAISAHHGNYIKDSEANKAKVGVNDEKWQAMRQSMYDQYCQTIVISSVPSKDSVSFAATTWLAGFVSVCDWIGSDSRRFTYGNRGHQNLVSYYEGAKDIARKALDTIGWDVNEILLKDVITTDEVMQRITSREGIKARPLQVYADDMLRHCKGPTLVLAEAPMGEGKTEMAFISYLRLQQANEHAGMYVALPTQATSNAMFDRVQKFLKNFVSSHVNLQLAHGGASMNKQVLELQSIAADPSASVSASQWFAQRKRPLLSPYGVGTVDQALLGVLHTKHQFVRIWGLSNRVIILDEIHAYDTYTSDLIARLLSWLKSVGSSVILMSATLPKDRRNELVAAWGVDHSKIRELSYPRLVVACDGEIQQIDFESRPLPIVDVAGIGHTLDDIAVECQRQLRDGGCGCIIVNTVGRAQALYRMLRSTLDQDTEIHLFHARYPADQRLEIEAQVMGAFGRAGQRPPRGLLIATQVAEQSLDIDFDFMISDLAPVDLLLQRVGRLHRHEERARQPIHATPVFAVAGLQASVPDLTSTSWKSVYDELVLYRTWSILSSTPKLRLPFDIDKLVQWVYSNEEINDAHLSLLGEKLDDALMSFHSSNKTEKVLASNSGISPENSIEHMKEKALLSDQFELSSSITRLGDLSCTLIPIHDTCDGWRIQEEDQAFSPNTDLSQELIGRLYARQIKLSGAKFHNHFKDKPAKACFENNVLSFFTPLPLRNGVYEDGDVYLKLDPKLGLLNTKTKDKHE